MHYNVAIQGDPGSYHEQAAVSYFGENVLNHLTYVDTFDNVFNGVRLHEYDVALVAIANNSVGFILEPHELLTTSPEEYQIMGETYVRVDHQLLGLPGATLGNITEVHSQAPALSQCTRYLNTKLPYATLVEQQDTAGSAEMIARWGDKTKAAIASARACELHGLVPLDSGIQNDRDNITRFLVLHRAGSGRAEPEADKTTWLLDTGQQPGSLYRALGPFSERGIGLSSLHSRFVPNSAFDMEFWVDVEAGEQDERMQDTRRRLEDMGCIIRSLGSYASADIPMSTR